MGNCGGKAVILEILSEQRTMRFTGTIKAKLDAKGRVFLPASFRRLLRDDEAEFVLKRDAFQPCLTVYPRAAWDAEVADLRSRLDSWRADHRMTCGAMWPTSRCFRSMPRAVSSSRNVISAWPTSGRRSCSSGWMRPSSYGPARATNSPSWATWPPIWKI